MKIFALIALPALFLANIGLEFYYNWLGITSDLNLDAFLKWRIVSVLSWQVFNFMGLMLMLYYGTFKKTFLAPFSLFAVLFVALGKLIEVMKWSDEGSKLIFAAGCILMVTYMPHFDKKEKNKILLDWLKLIFVISFSLNAAYNTFLKDKMNLPDVGDKILKLIMFIMFTVFYINLLKKKTQLNDSYLMVSSDGNQIFSDKSNNETL